MILNRDFLADWRDSVPSGKRLVVTNGCFDVIHAGHIDYLSKAKALGDFLLVGLNGDKSVKELKGESRPINGEEARAVILDSFRFVDAVCIFEGKRATDFLYLARPNIYVKGGDYTMESLDKEEVKAALSDGGVIKIIPFLSGFSSSLMLDKISKL